MKELYKYKDRVILYDTETKEVKELDKEMARKILDVKRSIEDADKVMGTYKGYTIKQNVDGNIYVLKKSGEKEFFESWKKAYEAIKTGAIKDSIEDAISKLVQNYLSSKKPKTKAEQDEIINFLLERNKIAKEDVQKVRSLLKIVKDSITEDHENEDIEYIDKDKVSKSRAKDILEIYDDTLIIVTDEKNRVVYKGIVDYAPKEIRDGRWHKGANNKTFTINTERGVLTVKVLDSSVRDSVEVEDAISYSQALENFKRFLKKHYEYTDEDLKKARVEFEKIDYPFKKSKEVWYGLPDGRVASYCSLDGKKWEDL